MRQPLSVVGMTVQVCVGDFSAGGQWYERLFGRPPDRPPHHTVWECEPRPMCCLQFVRGEAHPGAMRIRLSVADLAISPVERSEGIATWGDVDDPFGSCLGLCEDLADRTLLA